MGDDRIAESVSAPLAWTAVGDESYCHVTCVLEGRVPLVPGDTLRAHVARPGVHTIEVLVDGGGWARAGTVRAWPDLKDGQREKLQIEVLGCHAYECPLRLRVPGAPSSM